MAERMGFEPMVRSRESLVFKTSSINHSDTSPQWLPPNASIILAWKTGLVKPGCHLFLFFFIALFGSFFGPAAGPQSPAKNHNTQQSAAKGRKAEQQRNCV